MLGMSSRFFQVQEQLKSWQLCVEISLKFLVIAYEIRMYVYVYLTKYGNACT